MKQYHNTDMLLDLVFCRLPTWDPTRKKSQVCDDGNNCVVKDNMTLLDESTDEKATDSDSSDDYKDKGLLKSVKDTIHG